MTKAYDPSEDGALMRYDGVMTYGEYLQLPKILGAQAPLSSAPDELLFIIQHQTSELWMKLALKEMSSACRAIADDRAREAFKLLSRVARIFEQLNSAWDVLRTMTPSDYATFRAALGQSSGFQSYQYRAIEFLAGNKNAAMLQPHSHDTEVHADLARRLSEPSIYDQSLRLLARRGFMLDPHVLDRDFAEPYVPDDSVAKAWIAVYRDPLAHWEAYELAEKLMDFEDYFRRWRFNHVTTVERVIGMKRGTGGTSGVGYLKKMLSVVLFPELWSVRGEI